MTGCLRRLSVTMGACYLLAGPWDVVPHHRSLFSSSCGRKGCKLSPSLSPVSWHLVYLVKIVHSDYARIKGSEWVNEKTLGSEKHYCKWALWVHRELTAETTMVPFPSSGESRLLPTRCLPWKHLQKQLMRSLESQPSPQSSFTDSL